jgi:hypothetical protein
MYSENRSLRIDDSAENAKLVQVSCKEEQFAEQIVW